MGICGELSAACWASTGPARAVQCSSQCHLTDGHAMCSRSGHAGAEMYGVVARARICTASEVCLSWCHAHTGLGTQSTANLQLCWWRSANVMLFLCSICLGEVWREKK